MPYFSCCHKALYLLSKGMLSIHFSDSIADSGLDIDELWSMFTKKNEQFAVKYKVYVFFKEQGYVPPLDSTPPHLPPPSHLF